MKKIGVSPDKIPVLQTRECGDDDSNDDDPKYKFAAGHISTWWTYFMSLPSEVRPVFTPTAGFGDTFTLFSESGVIPILWGGDERRETSHPTKAVLEKNVCKRKEAVNYAKDEYGELFRRLFVGDRDMIRRDGKKRQTSYGRQAITMKQLAMDQPETYGHEALSAYWNELRIFYKARKNAIACETPCNVSPPVFPQGNFKRRYALSNFLKTEGLQVHVLAFDITKPYLSSKIRVNIQDIERRFPDRQSVVNTFGTNYADCPVVGVDPGEVIAASFCGLDPRAPKKVTNLHVKRAALYSPTLAYRRVVEQLKRQRPTVDPRATISPSLWAKKQSTAFDASESVGLPFAVELPSIQELEGSMLSSAFQSMDVHHAGLKQFFYVFNTLSGFYGSKSMKKKNWERRKSIRAEMDWAVNGAFQVISRTSSTDTGDRRPTLIVYGNGRFNTRTKLTSLHESFKGYFFMKVGCGRMTPFVPIR
jgi:hypothetical protein